MNFWTIYVELSPARGDNVPRAIASQDAQPKSQIKHHKHLEYEDGLFQCSESELTRVQILWHDPPFFCQIKLDQSYRVRRL